MKNLFRVLCMLILLFSLCSCKDNTSKPNEYSTMKTDVSKDSVKEFIALLDNLEPSGLISGYTFDEEHCYNVTPASVATETNMKIFKFSDSCASFVMLDNKVYPLCESFGGYGFVNAIPCDFDNDGNKDLLVASSWGSGVHCSCISVFNSQSKESTILYNSSASERVDLIVAAVTPSFSSIDLDDLPIYYQIYSAKIEINDNNFADLLYVAIDVIGSIENENGTPVFVPYQN